MRHCVTIEGSGVHYLCDAGQNLLQGMEALGRKGIPVGCRGGGCGICKVSIEAGEYRAAKMSRSHIRIEDEANGVLLACRTFPCSDLRLRVIGRLDRCLQRAFLRDAITAATPHRPAPPEAEPPTRQPEGY